MENFKRSPSKVWWAQEQQSSASWRYRSMSASPGSQDSGFSDTENSPPAAAAQDANVLVSTPQKPTRHVVPKDIFKNRSQMDQQVNLSDSYKEKKTPQKNLGLPCDRKKLSKTVDVKALQTPVCENPLQALSEPLRKHVSHRNSSKVSKNLFFSPPNNAALNQYSEQASTHSNPSSQRTYEISNKSSEAVANNNNRTLPTTGDNKYTISVQLNKSAPAVLAVLKEDECVGSFTRDDLTSESEYDSELETLFRGSLESPKHTSTPCEKMRHRKRKAHLNAYARQVHVRIPSLQIYVPHENLAVRRWLQDMKQIYEPECLTSLQCKSIAMELGEKVVTTAGEITATIRYILNYSNVIEKEFEAVRRETKYMGPLAQNLAGSIIEFIQNYNCFSQSSKLVDDCDSLRRAQPEHVPTLVAQLYPTWRPFLRDILVKEVGKLVERLENPRSEFDLRATLTGVTSIALRHEALVGFFVESGAIPYLLVLCEKCDGSSVRALILRALTTLCCTASAVRQLEKTSGMQLIADVVHDASRPEPERSEAVALLAQVTAPWIEDNQSVHGLHEESRKLVKGLTKFISTTKCCQNLLLCAAALANLTAMDIKCVKHVLLQSTVRILFDAVRQRGPRASVYLLEQVATLVANLSSTEEGRRQLTEERASTVLLCFLKTSEIGEDVDKRLQQRAIIALSRLCGDRNAAQQLVEAGGIEKLVRICREKKERYDSDAVLVAALATLRKIADTCGSSVINAQDVQELVEPRLLDSFLAYSTQNESYV